ncbi:YeaH/YhbH family protein [Nitrobacter sp. JJSN]|uniref:YeaH/YhbH family protein n=1 Tax=Nitrobacter sp. JJSN TaxID=3453033 RepID=UPI003F7776D3
MPIFIDRRLNPKDKNLGNRQRFLRRAREELKRSIRDCVRRDRISDADDEQAVSIPTRSTDEPCFKAAKDSGRREHVLPGNKHFVPGDRLRKPGHGDADTSGPSMKDSEDDFLFVLSREEVLDLFFEDLELPDMVKLSLKEIIAFRSRRAGFAATGSPTNIHVGRTMCNSYSRRIALKRPKREGIDAIRQEIAELEAGSLSQIARQRIAALQAEVERLEQKRRLIAYVDPVDIRFNRFEAQPVPNAKAVMFCLMDVSGSMGEREKDLAKRFFVLLHLFLKRRYDRIEIVFIRHTHEAQEVDEETFFYSTQSGGTVVSTALEKMHRIIAERYPSSEWNTYAAQASDGDNAVTDSQRCIALLNEEIMRLCQYYAYVEIIDERERDIFGTTDNGTSLWRAYSSVTENWPNFQMTRIAKAADIYPVFRQLFTRQAMAEGLRIRR